MLWYEYNRIGRLVGVSGWEGRFEEGKVGGTLWAVV